MQQHSNFQQMFKMSSYYVAISSEQIIISHDSTSLPSCMHNEHIVSTTALSLTVS